MFQSSDPGMPVTRSPMEAWGVAAAVALGLVAFLILVGWPTLLPTNIGWLNFADRAMHTLGWMFFREAPWGNPPGRSPDLGIELSSSIGLVDGLPLFALPLKLVSPWLPQPFQYWGYWLLLSFVLQSVFAYRIARELGAGIALALLAAGFALITPAYMFRVPMHLALSGHWTVLAALLLYIRRQPPAWWMWPLLIGLTAGIHAYLLAMLLALWGAALLQRLWSGGLGWLRAAREVGIGVGLTLGMLWVGGFFATPSIGSYGYGDYKLNLAWPVIRYRFSQVFPDLPHTKYDYEGLAFLGIGIFALLAIGLAAGGWRPLRAMVTRRWLPLLVVLLLLMVFAFSKDLAFFDVEVFEIPMPGWLADAAATFRSTGRFVWPLLYLVTIGTVVLLGRQVRPALALPIALAAFGAQIWDSGPSLHQFASRLAPISTVWTTPLESPFWERAAAAGYNRVRVIPVRDPGQDWQALGYYAVTHGMDIDTAYLGRLDVKGLAALRAHDAEILETGDFEPRTLYELDAASAAKVAAHLQPGDLLTVIDKRIVFARGGAALVEGLGVMPQLDLAH